MQKRIIALALALLLILMIVVCRMTPPAFADPLTLGSLASAAYAYGAAAGITFGFTNGTQVGAKQWMENQINSWLAGDSIAEKFGTEVLKAEAGKLIIPAYLATKIGQFLNDLMYDLGAEPDNTIVATEGMFQGHQLSSLSRNIFYGGQKSLVGLSVGTNSSESNVHWSPEKGAPSGGPSLSVYVDGNNKGACVPTGYYISWDGWQIIESGTGKIGVILQYQYNVRLSETSERKTGISNMVEIGTTADLTDRLEITLDSDYGYPEYPDVGYQWEGTVDGSTPDTNLDQLLDLIDTVVPQDLLDVEGEVVEPAPVPTPVPTWEPAPDVLSGLNEIGEEVVDVIGPGIGSIDQTTTDIAEDVQTIEQTITDALDIPTEAEAAEAKFDLSLLFPFCIPFDIYRMLQQFNSEPVAPHVQLPFVIESLGFEYNIDLDFAAWSPVAAALRAVEFILYGITLAWATSKVIKW